MNGDPGRPTSDDELDTLTRPARGERLLSPDEEVELAKQIERGDMSAKQRMIESNLGLVFTFARSYRGRGVPFADLVQEGTVGLVRAVEKFDHRRGLKFSTYAVWWIRRSLRDAIAAGQVIRIPTKANHQLAAVRRAEADLEHADEGPVSAEAIAARAGLGAKTVRSLRGAARVTASLDEPVGQDTTPLSDLIADGRAVDPLEKAIVHEERSEVRALLRLLPERHREVLVRRYGFNDNPEQSHEEIGQWLGVGEERSRQIEREALHRLRAISGPLARAA
jgi:RNA polymerase primary sigma factor